MGEEITRCQFEKQDFILFQQHLEQESDLLKHWFGQGSFAAVPEVGGFELEAWLVDPKGYPAPINEAYLAQLADPLVVPELAKFNIELNTLPRTLGNDALQEMHRGLTKTWNHCCQTAQSMGADLVMIGILPTVDPEDLTYANMTPSDRYRALNEQILRQTSTRRLLIQGRDELCCLPPDVTIESAATSFQIHLQVKPEQAVRFYNASQIISAPLVALAANSPYLFGYDLWAETRIPLFEQALAGTNLEETVTGQVQRVSFGSGYAQESLWECFQENLDRYEVLLPVISAEDPQRLRHLRLHNGTIWRWTRPLIGFDESGTPHVRIEQRVTAAGPTLIDMIANAALFYGLVYALATDPQPPEDRLPFRVARNNFYQAARGGLEAEIIGLTGTTQKVRECLAELLPLAHQGLQALNLNPNDIDQYLGIIEARLAKGQNGAVWQRAFVARHGPDRSQLTLAYKERQHHGDPVHTWDL